MRKTDKREIQDEVDLFLLFKKTKKFFLKLLLMIFKLFKNLLYNWKKFAFLVLIGMILGAVSNEIYEFPQKKEAKALLKINYGAGSYIYNSVNLINEKIKTNDLSFFSSQLNFDKNESISKISISPIIDLKDVINDQMKATEMNVFFNNIFDNNKKFAEEALKPKYKYHYLEIKLSEESTDASVQKIISYFNSNEILNNLKEITLEGISTIIYENKKTIKQINEILTSYNNSLKKQVPETQFYLDSNNTNIDELFSTKIKLQKENELKKEELLLLNDAVIIMNKEAILTNSKGVFSNNIILFPLIFLLVYVSIIILKALYRYLEQLDKSVN